MLAIAHGSDGSNVINLFPLPHTTEKLPGWKSTPSCDFPFRELWGKRIVSRLLPRCCQSWRKALGMRSEVVSTCHCESIKTLLVWVSGTDWGCVKSLKWAI
jgi:hypothetical protein